tara:strand:+ start:26513 stop:26680 length:168 start_codon:yes stop_codon:yes gene_type:complete
MKSILSKSVEARLSDSDKSILKNYWSLLEGDDFADALVFNPNEKPKKKEKKDKSD